MRETAKKYGVFAFVIIVLIVLALLTVSLLGNLSPAVAAASQPSSFGIFSASNLIWLAILAVFLLAIWRFEFIVFLKDFERAVIFRFGKINRVGGPGWAIIIPGAESYRRVDLRAKTYDLERQDVITKDSIELRIDSVIYLKVKDDPESVINSVVKIVDYVKASTLFVTSAIRDKVGSLELSEVISNVEKLNISLKKELERMTDKWGIAVQAVEIKDIQIPRTILDAMHAEKAAVREKLARMEKAKAKEAEIEAVQRASANLTDKTLGYYYIKALEEMSKGKSTKLVFPLEFSRLAKSLGGVADEPKVEQTLDKYKGLLEDYVSKAVKKAKKEEKAETIEIEENAEKPPTETTESDNSE